MIAIKLLWLTESAGLLCSLFRQTDFRAMPSILERRRALLAVAMSGRVADEIVAGKLVVARHFSRIETANANPLERVAGKLIRRELLVPDGDILTGGIEVVVREMADLVREDRVEHRADGVGVVDSHPLLEQAVEELLVVEDASSVAGVGRAGTERLVDLEIGAPHIVELGDDRLVGLAGGVRGFTARGDGAVGRRNGGGRGPPSRAGPRGFGGGGGGGVA